MDVCSGGWRGLWWLMRGRWLFQCGATTDETTGDTIEDTLTGTEVRDNGGGRLPS